MNTSILTKICVDIILHRQNLDIRNIKKELICKTFFLVISLSVRLENCSTKSANNSFPRFAVERNTAKSRLCHHISNAGTTAAPGASTRRRFTPPYFPLLIHKKAETSHISKHKCCFPFLI